jgi:WhiB family transcriptional regulator, redox-sensing transcriptional regulator
VTAEHDWRRIHAERTHGQYWQSAAMPAPELAGELPCQAGPDLFFSADRADIKRAKRICLDCPALAACREWALTRPEWYGVWGGLSERERRRIYRTRLCVSLPSIRGEAGPTASARRGA